MPVFVLHGLHAHGSSHSGPQFPQLGAEKVRLTNDDVSGCPVSYRPGLQGMQAEPRASRCCVTLDRSPLPGPLLGLLSCKRLQLVLFPPKHLCELWKTSETSGGPSSWGLLHARSPWHPTLQGHGSQEAGHLLQASARTKLIAASRSVGPQDLCYNRLLLP